MSTLQRYYGLLPQKSDPLKEQCTEMTLFSEAAFTTNSNKREVYSRRAKKSDADLPCDSATPEMGESRRCFMRNTASEDSLTHPLLVNGFNFVRKSASASGLRLRF